MYKAKVIIEEGTRYFYDENNFCYKNEPFSRFYKVSEKKEKKRNEWKKRKKIETTCET